MTAIRQIRTMQQGMTLVELSVVLLILIALAGMAVPYVGGLGSTAMCQTTDATMQAVKEAIMGGKSGPGFYGDMLGRYPALRNTPAGYSLTYLFEQGDWQAYNPKTGMGWRGPYLSGGANLSVAAGSHFVTAAYAHAQSNGQTGINDAWGRPLVLQVPSQASCDKLTNRTGTQEGECARLVSAGPGSGPGNGSGDIDTLIEDDPLTTGAAEIEAMRSLDDRILYLRIPAPINDSANISCAES